MAGTEAVLVVPMALKLAQTLLVVLEAMALAPAAAALAEIARTELLAQLIAAAEAEAEMAILTVAPGQPTSSGGLAKVQAAEEEAVQMLRTEETALSMALAAAVEKALADPARKG